MIPPHSPARAGNPTTPASAGRIRPFLLPLLFLAAAPLALAHPGHGPGDGFLGGIAHPLTGWDHALAMIAVGIWAFQLGGRARWFIPAAFVGMVAAGAVLGHFQGTVPGGEQAIAASVLILGLLVAAAVRLPAAASVALVGVFALFHGIAHGAEMPATAGGLAYGAGFCASTALLHAAGIAVGFIGARWSARIPRMAGLAIVASGIFLLAS